MPVTLPDDPSLLAQATAAGFASVESYIYDLIGRDAERLAILAGYNAVREGRVRPFEEFDREFRSRYGLAPNDHNSQQERNTNLR